MTLTERIDVFFEKLSMTSGDIKRSEIPGILFHNLDTESLSSGGVILQDGQAVGVHIGSKVKAKETDETINVGIELLKNASLPKEQIPMLCPFLP